MVAHRCLVLLDRVLLNSVQLLSVGEVLTQHDHHPVADLAVFLIELEETDVASLLNRCIREQVALRFHAQLIGCAEGGSRWVLAFDPESNFYYFEAAVQL